MTFLIGIYLLNFNEVNFAQAREINPPERFIPNDFTPSWFTLEVGQKNYQLELKLKGVDLKSLDLGKLWWPFNYIGGLGSISDPSPFRFLQLNPGSITVGEGLPPVRGLELKIKW